MNSPSAEIDDEQVPLSWIRKTSVTLDLIVVTPLPALDSPMLRTSRPETRVRISIDTVLITNSRQNPSTSMRLSPSRC